MEKILAEILAADKNILARRDDLIAELDKKVPGNLSRDYTPIKKAINLNVGEIFFVNDLDTAKTEVADILKSSGMQEARINFVIDTFANAIVEAGKSKKVPEKKVEGVSVAEFFQRAKVETEKNKPANHNNTPASVTNQPAPQENISQPAPQNYQPQQNSQSQPDNTKKFLIGVICVLAVALFMVIGNHSKTEPEVSELSLGGIELGMTESEVIKILGQPTVITEGDIASTGYDYEYESCFIRFARTDGTVSYIWSKNPNFKTKRGIHAGSTEKDMRDAYEIYSAPPINDSEWDVYDKSFETADGRQGEISFLVDKSSHIVEAISVVNQD